MSALSQPCPPIFWAGPAQHPCNARGVNSVRAARAAARAAARRGSVTVFVALALIGILGVVAVAVDGGMLLDKRRQAQAIADAVALAAADTLYKNYRTFEGLDTNGAAKEQALRTASQNGYANDKTTSIVSMRFSPEKYADGPNKGKTIPAGYVEVILQYNQSRFFSMIFGSAPVPVKSRAVARGSAIAADVGILALNPTIKGSFNAQGGGLSTVTQTPIVVNSNHAEAAIAGGGGTVSADEYFR